LGDTHWITLPQDRAQWRAVVNIVMNIQVCKMFGSSRVPKQLVLFQEGLGPIELVTVTKTNIH
jgi:hypothetical protein